MMRRAMLWIAAPPEAQFSWKVVPGEVQGTPAR
jgi:hypothetical protein